MRSSRRGRGPGLAIVFEMKAVSSRRCNFPTDAGSTSMPMCFTSSRLPDRSLPMKKREAVCSMAGDFNGLQVVPPSVERLSPMPSAGA